VKKQTILKGTRKQGTLILDPTCTMADMRYPTDLGLLNEVWKILDGIIDALYELAAKYLAGRELTVKCKKNGFHTTQRNLKKRNCTKPFC